MPPFFHVYLTSLPVIQWTTYPSPIEAGTSVTINFNVDEALHPANYAQLRDSQGNLTMGVVIPTYLTFNVPEDIFNGTAQVLFTVYWGEEGSEESATVDLELEVIGNQDFEGLDPLAAQQAGNRRLIHTAGPISKWDTFTEEHIARLRKDDEELIEIMLLCDDLPTNWTATATVTRGGG